MLSSQQPHAYTGIAAQINSCDGNRTVTDGTFCAIVDRESGTFEADIVWGGGSVHCTYQQTTCRVRGEVSADGSMSLRADFSNGPWEEWRGKLRDAPDPYDEQNGLRLELHNGKYVWHGWNGRRAAGKLELKLVRVVSSGAGDTAHAETAVVPPICTTSSDGDVEKTAALTEPDSRAPAHSSTSFAADAEETATFKDSTVTRTFEQACVTAVLSSEPTMNCSADSDANVEPIWSRYRSTSRTVPSSLCDDSRPRRCLQHAARRHSSRGTRRKTCEIM